MIDENTSLRAEAESAYLYRLGAGTVAVGLAAGYGQALYAGGGEHWLRALLIVCFAGAVGAVLALDVIQRWQHLRRTLIVGPDSSKPFGFAGPAADPVSDLKRTTRRKTTGLH